MAIERNIPQDICQYESKLIGPLTTRQVGFLIPALVLGIGAFILTGKLGWGQDARIFTGILLSTPFLLCGWVKLYGITFEKFISMIFVTQFLAPKHRLYKTENTFKFLAESDVPVDTKALKKKQDTQKKYISKDKNLKPFK